MVHTVGVVLAAGAGTRIGGAVPKQMVQIAGRTILEHAVRALHSSAHIDEVIVMIPVDWTLRTAQLLGSDYPKLSRILEGGITRNDTTGRVLEFLGAGDHKVLLHDGARPLLSEQIIAECVVALDRYDAVCTVIPSTDTVVTVDAHGLITSMPDRGTMRRAQTPQGFRVHTLRDAYKSAASDPLFAATDDCGVVHRYCPDVEIVTVDGAETNVKITHSYDLSIAAEMLAALRDVSPGG